MLPSILFALSFFGPLSLAVVPPRRDLLHIPVIRRNHARRGEEADTAHYSAVLAGLRHKYGYDSPGASRRAQTTDIGITNQGADVSYSAQVNVGTPAQSFNLALDTGSSDLWLATTVCASCPSGTPEFDPSKSTSLQTGTDPISLKYGSGSAAGTIARDTITMGPFTVNQQIFVAVTDITSGLIEGALAGIMGLAFQGIASTDALPFWQALVNDNLFTNPEFSFFITRFVDDASAKDEEPGGVLTLGGTNTTLYQGDIDFRSFTSPIRGGSFWLQTVTGVTVNGKSVSLPSGDLAVAAIDTGTTLIGGPTAAVNAIWAAVPGAVAGDNLAGSFAFPCNTDLSISMSFGGPSWPISLADMNLGTVGNGRCLGAIFDITIATNVTPGEGNPAWIIGDTFLKNVYSVFRASPPAVGFAQLSNAAGGSSDNPLPASGTATITGGTSPTPSSGGAGSTSACRTARIGAFDVFVTSALVLLATAFTLMA
ncbi:acid protease [Lactarius hengduanensis]|nr:acid protease [Lactarius hengduanensis]